MVYGTFPFDEELEKRSIFEDETLQNMYKTEVQVQKEGVKNSYEKWNLFRIIKVTLISIICILCFFILETEPEIASAGRFLISVSKTHAVDIPLVLFDENTVKGIKSNIHVSLMGPFFSQDFYEGGKELSDLSISLINKKSEVLESVTYKLLSKYDFLAEVADTHDQGSTITTTLSLKDLYPINVTLEIQSNSDDAIPLFVTGYFMTPSMLGLGKKVVYGGIALIGLYVLIMFELTHRTTASMLIATSLIAIVGHFSLRPPLDYIIRWLDVETLVLLFSMMVIVSIVSETNVFSYVGYKAFQISKGNIWTLVMLLSLSSALISTVLDNVTTILLLTPVIIQFCEVMKADTRKVLIIVTIFSNIGGSSTIIGDPPNVIIASDQDLSKYVSFGKFLAHIGPISFLIAIMTYALIKYVLCRRSILQHEPQVEIKKLNNEIDIWYGVYDKLPDTTKADKSLRLITMQKIRDLKSKQTSAGENDEQDNSMEEKCRIKNKTLLKKCVGVLSVMLIFFFLENTETFKLSLGWIALMGAIFLLVLTDSTEVESIFLRVEWSTLIFFACLFVIMGALDELQFLDLLGSIVKYSVDNVRPTLRLPVSILLVLWISGLVSSIVDNIPFTTVMIPVIKSISYTGVPIEPLIWALSLGTCLGGNGTLVGASANLVCAGIAEQYGYKFTFWSFFKIGFPVVLLSLSLSSLYLIICHVVFQWH